MIDEGVDMIDVGGESTRPGADPVPDEVEMARVLPVIEAIASRVPVSIDTRHAAVARAAVAAAACSSQASARGFTPACWHCRVDQRQVGLSSTRA